MCEARVRNTSRFGETSSLKRFPPHTSQGVLALLAYKLNGKSINDVLSMSVQQALEYFQIKELIRKLKAIE